MLTLYAIINFVMLRMLCNYTEMPSAVRLEHNTVEPLIVWGGFAIFVVAISYVLVFLDSSQNTRPLLSLSPDVANDNMTKIESRY